MGFRLWMSSCNDVIILDPARKHVANTSIAILILLSSVRAAGKKKKERKRERKKLFSRFEMSGKNGEIGILKELEPPR